MTRFHGKNLIWLTFISLCFLVIGLMIHLDWINAYYEVTLVTIMINIIYAVGLNLILGVAGQFSLGHAAFIAVGAYSAALISKSIANPWLAIILSFIVGMALAAVLAFLVGLPTLRLKGDYLAIATLGAAEMVRVLLINWRGLTNGAAGINNIPLTTSWQLTFVILVLTTILILNYTYSSVGRATLAMSQDEIAAEAMGVPLTKYKLGAFILGAMTAAMGGALQANFIGVVTPSDYTFNRSIDILIIVVFGGIGSYTGSFLAAIILGLINLVLQDYGQLRMVFYALALILIMIFRPAGLMGNKEWRLASQLQGKIQQRKEA